MANLPSFCFVWNTRHSSCFNCDFMASTFQHLVRDIVSDGDCDWKQNGSGDWEMFFSNRKSEFEVYNITVVDGVDCLQKGIMKVDRSWEEDFVVYPDESFEDKLQASVDEYTPGDILWIHPVKRGMMSCNFTYKTFQSEENSSYDTPTFYLVGEEEIIPIG